MPNYLVRGESEESMMIINLTQHQATPEQLAVGVVDLKGEALSSLRRWLTADTLASVSNDEGDNMHRETRADLIANLAEEVGAKAAMVGGAPWLMAPLERALLERGIQPMYAFSRRESVEEAGPDGSVIKRSVFRHEGFVIASI